MTDGTDSLHEVATGLRDGSRDLPGYLAGLYDHIERREPDVDAWVGGPKPREWLDAEAEALEERYPDPASRPPLFGVPVGVKDIFHVDGLPTRAGAGVPPGRLAGPQADVVSTLRGAGALVLGKTVTTEFAYFEPGPTRNPRDPGHTPGGSSSGSAAAVAAGMCPLALGSQTIGSVIRPAAFCGVVGFKPSYGRIPLDGVLPLSTPVDHVGLFTPDVPGMRLAAATCLDDWTAAGGLRARGTEDRSTRGTDDGSARDAVGRPVLGVPDDEYLSQASRAGREAFESQVETLEAAGFDVRRVRAFEDVEAVNERHKRVVAAGAAESHHDWFAEFREHYAESTAELVEEGQSVSVEAYLDAKRGRGRLRERLEATMDEHAIDVWASPSAPGPAPAGIGNTGDPVMNGPWTHAGTPAVTVPAGEVDGLPVGLQCVARFGDDERLLDWAEPIGSTLSSA